MPIDAASPTPEEDSFGDDADAEGEITEIRQLAESVLERIPEESKTEEVVVDAVLQVVRTHHKSYRGPHPSPAMLAELKAVDPDLPGRCMEFAEREQLSRHQDVRDRSAAVRRYQWFVFTSRLIGQILAVVVVLAVIGTAAGLIYSGRDAAPMAPIIYALSFLASVIIAAETATRIWGNKSAEDDDDETTNE